MHFVVKLFPEITIKSPPVRKRFIKQLRENLRAQLVQVDPAIAVVRDWEKIEVTCESADEQLWARVSDVLARTPGIANFVRVQAFPLGDMDDIFQKTLPIWGPKLAGKTFCVRVKRSGNHDFSSIDVERYVGGGLNQHTGAKGVSLKQPDVTVKLEIRADTLYVVEEQTPGLGGFPLGSQEGVLSLISGGFDSTVASYLMIKRGVRTHYCFFNLGGKAHELGVKEVAFYLWNKFGSSHPVKFVTVPFEGVVSQILQNVDNSYMGVVLKRMMLRAATQVAAELDLPALVTGEAVAQVSSQTLPNLAAIDAVTDTLVLRPLVVMDKGDIIDISRAIGTEDFAASMPEYCGVISVKPTTRAKMDRVLHAESKFDFDVLEQAIGARRTQFIQDVVADLEQTVVSVEQVADPQQAVVVDIRHPNEEELRPLRLANVEVLKIPFFSLNTRFAALDAGRQYLLYCDKGVMSQLHAEHLKDAGFDNVGVYRPAPKAAGCELKG
ncbi:tRNA 4-thiouridine(8) synthase ThiI [Simiduia sp. 21SJ11W-1]|uniref:tRNA uracil 4-sulfurtransferase ThiI n=1 Tax=Simiduia sp. 21SJ11W-1 TaxID=2909669 RepID=UPI00209FF456|nr:tRNA uracil 4-sulfurtransferase ThiI [Simiduia sp. 21SJ11W-1]UTA48480.1 tRNA 4-thiouridine(8) synthase ThiI [Simiduia sp. 21SJ11W-1]